MKKAFMPLLVIALIPALASPQTTKLIFGPRDGDNAGILYVYANQAIEVDVWIRSVYDTCLYAVHLPLSSKNLYIQANSREAGDIFFPFTEWMEVTFLPPAEDESHEGYTNQSIIGVAGFIPYYVCKLWWNHWYSVATYRMTTAADVPYDTPLCDALIEGWDADDGGLILISFEHGEMDPSEYQVEFACLQFMDNICGDYVMGDFNGSGVVNVADIVDGYSKLKTGSPDPLLLCECPAESGNEWPVAADVNNSCDFNIADIVDSYSKLKTGSPELIPCIYCPPEGWNP